MTGFRLVGLRIYEGDEEKLAKCGVAIVPTGYQVTTGLPEYVLTFAEDDQEAA